MNKKRLCEVCDIPLMPDYPYDACEECCNALRAAIAEPAVGLIDDDEGTDGYSAMVN